MGASLFWWCSGVVFLFFGVGLQRHGVGIGIVGSLLLELFSSMVLVRHGYNLNYIREKMAELHHHDLKDILDHGSTWVT
jgi:hypothetical protein